MLQFIGLGVILSLPLLLLLVLLVRLVWRRQWIAGWLYGNVLVLFAAVLVIGGAAAWELQSFRSLAVSEPVLKVKVSQLQPALYRLTLDQAGKRRIFDVSGDLWELDVQVLRWKGLSAAIGLEDGYRLHQLRGRHLGLEEQQRTIAHNTHPLHGSPSWRDLWFWLERCDRPVLVESDAFTLAYMPLADEAEFAVRIGVTGLIPEPLNAAAMRALRP